MQVGRRHHSITFLRERSTIGISTAIADMAQQTGKFAYTVVYVKDVAQSADFYKKAFGINVRRLDQSHRWGELESGETTIAFTPLKQHEVDITGGVQSADLGEPRHNVELSFSYSDVDEAFKHAVATGAVPVAQPEEKEWGQKVGYVRDINGIMIRMGSMM